MVLTVLSLLGLTLVTAAPDGEPRRTRVSITEEATRLLGTPERRVRSTDPQLVRLLEMGARRSYSFAELVRSLHETDVIVYVEVVSAMPRFVDGHTFLVSSREGQRYLRIQVRPGLHPDDTIALIAHELRHALEVAEERGVTTQAAFAAFYGRIGQAVAGHESRFDTEAARAMGRMVRRELGG